MTKKLATLAALLVLSACRSAFMPEPVTRVSAPPPAQVAATTSADTALRRAPAVESPALKPVAAGTALQVSNEVVHGFRRVKLASGESGYVDARALTLDAPAAASAPAADPAVPAPK
jgi:hypothetical protein